MPLESTYVTSIIEMEAGSQVADALLLAFLEQKPISMMLHGAAYIGRVERMESYMDPKYRVAGIPHSGVRVKFEIKART